MRGLDYRWGVFGLGELGKIYRVWYGELISNKILVSGDDINDSYLDFAASIRYNVHITFSKAKPCYEIQDVVRCR